MNEINKFTKLPKGLIMLNKKIYMQYDNTDGSIPENTIMRNRIIYAEFEENSLNKVNENSLKNKFSKLHKIKRKN